MGTLLGAHTTEQAEGAIPNGSRIRKAVMEEGDTHPIGALATVVGSVGPLPFRQWDQVYGYFVEWDEMPGVAVFVHDGGGRIEKVEGAGPCRGQSS